MERALWWTRKPVNHCHYENDTTIIQMSLYREFQGPFLLIVFQKNGSTFALMQIHVQCIF